MNVRSKLMNALDALLLSGIAAVQITVWAMALNAVAAPAKSSITAPLSAVAHVIETVEVRG